MGDPYDDRRTDDARQGGEPSDVCPFLGLTDDDRPPFGFPSSENRCHAATTPIYVELAHQGTYCLTAKHARCARYPVDEPTVPLVPTPAALPVADAPTSVAAAGDPSAPRPGTSLPPRGGFGSLADMPRGWVPVEAAAATTAVPGEASDAPGAAAGPEVEPASGPASFGPVAEPETPEQAMSDVDLTDPERAPDDSLWSVAEQEAADEARQAPEGDTDTDAEGIGALVAGGAVAAGAAATAAAPAATPAGAAPGEEPAGAAPGEEPAGAAPGEERWTLVPGGPSAGSVEPADQTEGAAPSSATGDAARVGPEPGGAPSPGIGGRLAGIVRHALRLVAIAVAGVLVLAALVGVGYVAGKLLVRPGETPATPASSIALPTPVTSPAAPGETVPGSGGAATTVPSGSGASAAPSASAAPTSKPTPKPTPKATPGPRVYVVRPGDTLFRIAARFGVTVNAIIEANHITDPNAIYTGQRLVIPRP